MGSPLAGVGVNHVMVCWQLFVRFRKSVNGLSLVAQCVIGITFLIL